MLKLLPLLDRSFSLSMKLQANLSKSSNLAGKKEEFFAGLQFLPTTNNLGNERLSTTKPLRLCLDSLIALGLGLIPKTPLYFVSIIN